MGRSGKAMNESCELSNVVPPSDLAKLSTRLGLTGEDLDGLLKSEIQLKTISFKRKRGRPRKADMPILPPLTYERTVSPILKIRSKLF
jgi:hypothetical protein